jgi:hypothetical protein
MEVPLELIANQEKFVVFIGPVLLGSMRIRFDHEAVNPQNGSVPFQVNSAQERSRVVTESSHDLSEITIDFSDSIVSSSNKASISDSIIISLSGVSSICFHIVSPISSI